MTAFAAALVVASAAFPAAAQAGTIIVRPELDQVSFVDNDAAPNRLTVRETDTAIIFEDTVAPITAAAPCVQETPSRVSCPPRTTGSVSAHTASGDDEVSLALRAGGTADRKITVEGGPGADTINGGATADHLLGGEGEDFIIGGAGDDMIDPGPGRDKVYADDGGDSIETRDAPAGADPFDQAYYDWVVCGEGIDYYTPDPVEFRAIAPQDGCENVTRPPGEFGPGEHPPTTPVLPPTPVTPPTPPAPAVVALAAKTATARGKTVALPFQCPATSASDCTGRVRLLSGKKVLADGKVAVKKGRKGSAKLKLTSAGRKLKRKRAVKVKVVTIPAGAKAHTTLGTLKLAVR